MKPDRIPAHFVHNYLINPTNPVTVAVIGAGGTGSQVITALARINHSLVALRHAGLQVKVYDDDVITAANLGGQLFAQSEMGLPKAVALINRVNRFFGSNWKADTERIVLGKSATAALKAHLIISCVDTVATRLLIADTLHVMPRERANVVQPLYWMDFGNSQYNGQVVLGTCSTIQQPASKKFLPVASLPFITDEYKNELGKVVEDATPSCSLAEALTKQDLFINSTLASMGASLLWSMFREGMVTCRGMFLNLKNFQTQPIPLS